MKKKGINSIVAVSVLALVGILAVGIFLGVYLKTIKKSTDNDAASCFGIEIGIKECITFNQTINPILPPEVTPLTGSAVLANIERSPGGGEITGIKIIVEDTNGNQHAEDPVNISFLGFSADTDFSDLVEYNSVDVVAKDLPYTPVSVRVSAIVGENTVCNPTIKPKVCRTYP